PPDPLRGPTFQVRGFGPSVATNGAWGDATNTWGGISGGAAMNPPWFESEFAGPYGRLMLVTFVVLYWKIAFVTPALLVAIPSTVGTMSETKRRLSSR